MNTTVMADTYIENYKSKHRHPLNKLCHAIGIPAIVISLPLFLFNWRWALTLFVLGWIFQFIGHAIEGNQPAFFQNPIYFLVGPWWLIRRLAEAVVFLRLPRQNSSVQKRGSSPTVREGSDIGTIK